MRKEDLQALRNTLDMYYPIADLQWDNFYQKIRYKEVKKGDYIVREGDCAKEICFIVSGLFRVYCLTLNGDERTYVFRRENEFISAYSSFLEDKTSDYNIQAIEDGMILSISTDDYNKLVEADSYWEILSGRYTKKLFLEKELREKAFLTEDATTRYQKFVQDYREIEKRITNNYIASYLGITPVALSRIRGKLLK